MRLSSELVRGGLLLLLLPLEVEDVELEAGGPLPAGMCTPVAALGDALVAQLREMPGVRLEGTVQEHPPSRKKLQ